MREYKICLGSEIVGQAQVDQQGLYYIFNCSCELKSDIICRIIVSCGGRRESLGILVPEGDRYILRKKVPVKYLGHGLLEFQIIPRNRKTKGQFISVYPEEPFHYIRRLQNAFLERRQGNVGIVVPD